MEEITGQILALNKRLEEIGNELESADEMNKERMKKESLELLRKFSGLLMALVSEIDQKIVEGLQE